jgi:hypothetical protein
MTGVLRSRCASIAKSTKYDDSAECRHSGSLDSRATYSTCLIDYDGDLFPASCNMLRYKTIFCCLPYCVVSHNQLDARRSYSIYNDKIDFLILLRVSLATPQHAFLEFPQQYHPLPSTSHRHFLFSIVPYSRWPWTPRRRRRFGKRNGPMSSGR